MTGNKIADNIIAALNLLGLLVGVGFVYYTNFIYQRPLPSEQVEQAHLIEEAAQLMATAPVRFKRRTVNLLSGPNKLRFLDFQMYVLPFKEAQTDEINKNESLIFDTAIELAGRFTAEELNTVAGKILFEGRIKKQLNSYFNPPLVKKIYFTKFVVQ